ncbi:MAPEG family protein [Aquimixticola soesokkakensis]|uniref:MAPEG family protein n=1 Tax=Aquimixticola soesokkakensis TaxID=1519096 RepID=A0A1Y5TD18_9RHOB|nr:MAPEG family protein [Aquimixticola soesokkakensis]SLN61253.1 MAPEG family protein [Aquimixticola soesokkakensis]
MTPELLALGATALIHVAIVGWSQKSLEADVGHEGNVGTRENLDARLSEKTKRLRRALANHTENIALFVIAVVMVQFTGSNGWFTAICAWVFVIARALYVPAYAFAWVPYRSLIFTVGLVACLAMIIASLF